MPAFFPAPYEDELLYSLCARYARLTHLSDQKSTVEHLFRRRTLTAVVDLPTHLSALAEQLLHLHGPTAEEFIEEHTLLPYYTAFHPPERRFQARLAMQGEGQPHWLLGLMASQVLEANALRYCPQCVVEDRQRQGETYWRRSHQLPGVLVCIRHSVWLEDSDIRIPAASNRHVFWCAETCIPKDSLARQLSGSPILLDLAQRAAELLQRGHWEANEKRRQERYSAALAERHLATYSGQLRVKELLRAFQLFLPDSLAHQLGIQAHSKDWLLRLLRKPRAALHTLYHLIFQSFAGLTLDDLEVPFQPFGAGPWPCLNQASEHYRERLINAVDITYTLNERAPIGQFACRCGFTYRRTGPDQNPDDVYRLERMAEYGPVWQQVLKDAWLNPNLSLRELSRKLGFDPITVKKQAAALGLPQVRPGSRGGQSHHVSKKMEGQAAGLQKRRQYRKRWQQAKAKDPELTLKMLRKKEPGVYTWLYRNDRAWLREHQPRQIVTPRHRQRVDWEARDLTLVAELRKAALRLKRRQPFVRISPSRLAREIGQAALLTQHLDKLPSCQKALLQLTESREAFAVRRIRVVTDGLLKAREQVSDSQLMRRCGLRPEMLHLPGVKTAFEQARGKLRQIGKVQAA